MRKTTTTMLGLIGMAASTKLLREKTENKKLKHPFANQHRDFAKPHC